MNSELQISFVRYTIVALTGVMMAGCGSSDPAIVTGNEGGVVTVLIDPPVLLADTSVQCTEPHTVCMTVEMPHMIPGAPTHLAVGYYQHVPVMESARARAVLQSPPLTADQVFRIKVGDGSLTGALYPVVLVYMPGGGDIIAVDNLDYTAEASKAYDLAGAPLNLSETLKLVFGI
jgi:hypothetical protein